MEVMEFTENEVREQLKQFGYTDVSLHRLRQFKRDLDALVQKEKSKDSSLSSSYLEVTAGVPSGCQPDVSGRLPLVTDRVTPQVTGGLTGPSRVTIKHPPPARFTGWTDKENAVLPLATFPRPYGAGRGEAGPRGGHGGDFSLYSEGDALEGRDAADGLDTTSESERQRGVMKRKVLRKQNGQSVVVDESVTESETDELMSLQQRLANMPVIVTTRGRPMSAPTGHWAGYPQGQDHPGAEPCYRLPVDYDRPKALIRVLDPQAGRPARSDPVARIQEYRSGWRTQRAPGEKTHAALRWSVRAALLQQDSGPDKRPQKCFVPNSYEVPTEKKRKSLRWQMRQDLAQGVVPASAFD